MDTYDLSEMGSKCSDIPGQKVVDAVVGMMGDALQHVAHIASPKMPIAVNLVPWNSAKSTGVTGGK